MTRIAHPGLALVALVGITAAGWLAAQPYPSQTVHGRHAVGDYVRDSDCCAVVSFALRSVHFAAADGEYALATLAGVGDGSAPVDPARAVLHRELGVWHVLTLGSDDLGCDIPLQRVRDELGIGCADDELP